jgi:hypothetical protein
MSAKKPFILSGIFEVFDPLLNSIFGDLPLLQCDLDFQESELKICTRQLPSKYYFQVLFSYYWVQISEE